MPDVTLTEDQQRALCALFGAAPSGYPHEMAREDVLLAIAELIPCDTVGAVVQDRDGERYERVQPRTRERAVPAGGSASIEPSTALTHRRADTAPVVRYEISVDLRHRADQVAQVWLSRTGVPFTPNERAVLAMIMPEVQRLMRTTPTRCAAPLTVQERRVLSCVAAGRSNAEIAAELFVAASTVRKHLEHAYRKLGVSSRLAAVARIEGRFLPGSDACVRAGFALVPANTPIRE
jgi:DNA-binding CsgD family transcriptional regulator